MKKRIFNIMQYEFNPITKEDLHFNETNIVNGISHKSIKRWAYICHDKDTFTDKDFDDGLCTKEQIGQTKEKHWHVVLDCPNQVELSAISKWFGVPENFIELPKGHGAFLDCVEYLTHEDNKQQELGKNLYNDDEVKSNFNFRQELEKREERLLRYGKDLSVKQQMEYDVMYLGKTLKECEKEDPILYMENCKKLKERRLEYIYNVDVPNTRLNYYIEGKGGYGKDIASRALARSLFPQYTRDEEIFFEVGAKNTTFEGYDGQPVIIWSEYRAITLLDVFGGRENLFKVFDSHPHNSRVNIKYGSVKLINTVNIVNSVQNYQEFLDGLAGEYVDKQGNKQVAEDKGQSYRRFPCIIPLHTNDMDIMFSKYFTGESDNPTEYEQWKKICGNFRRIRVLCKNNEELARKIENKMLVGLPEKSHKLLANEPELTEEQILKELEHFGDVVDEEVKDEPKQEEKETNLLDFINPDEDYSWSI